MWAQLLLQGTQQESFRKIHAKQWMQLWIGVRLRTDRHQQRGEQFLWSVRVVRQHMLEVAIERNAN